MMQDKLMIQGLEFHGHCGITEEEQKVGQRLSLDLEMGYDRNKAAKTDKLADAIDYAAVSKRLTEIGQDQHFQLIETLAERLTEVLLTEFGIQEVRLKLKKFHPPIKPIMQYAAIEIFRTS